MNSRNEKEILIRYRDIEVINKEEIIYADADVIAEDGEHRDVLLTSFVKQAKSEQAEAQDSPT